MLVSIILIGLFFAWMLHETKYLTIQLLSGKTAPAIDYRENWKTSFQFINYDDYKYIVVSSGEPIPQHQITGYHITHGLKRKAKTNGIYN